MLPQPNGIFLPIIQITAIGVDIDVIVGITEVVK